MKKALSFLLSVIMAFSMPLSMFVFAEDISSTPLAAEAVQEEILLGDTVDVAKTETETGLEGSEELSGVEVQETATEMKETALLVTEVEQEESQFQETETQEHGTESGMSQTQESETESGVAQTQESETESDKDQKQENDEEYEDRQMQVTEAECSEVQIQENVMGYEQSPLQVTTEKDEEIQPLENQPECTANLILETEGEETDTENIEDNEVTERTADVEAPVIDAESITMEKFELSEGLAVGFSLNVSDDISGVGSVWIVYQYPSGQEGSFSLSLNESSGKYEGALCITNEWEYGTYRIKYIAATDLLANQTVLYNSNIYTSGSNVDLSYCDFEAGGVPVIDIGSVSVDKTEVTTSDFVTCSMMIADDKSESLSVWVFYQCPSSQNQESLLLTYNEDTGRYEGTLNITDAWETGTYEIFCICVSDGDNDVIVNNALFVTGNSSQPKAYLNSANFEVFRDEESPIYISNSLEASRKSLTGGETTDIRLSAIDEYGISNVRIVYQKPVTGGEYGLPLLSSGSDVYTCQFSVEEYYETGLWQVKYIEIEDNYNNTLIVYNSKLSSDAAAVDLSSGDFAIEGTQADIEGPVIDVSSLQINKKSLPDDQMNVVRMNVRDDISGVIAVQILYRSASGGILYAVDLENEYSDSYMGYISCPGEEYWGSWESMSIIATDMAGNQSVIYEGLDAIAFEFYNEMDRISIVEGVTAYQENAYVSDTTIWGDVYIGPSAVVTLSNVTVYGNIYLLGSAQLVNVTAAGIIGRNLTWGSGSTSFTFGNGKAYLSESTSISHMMCTTYPVEYIPYSLENNTGYNVDGKLFIQGSTLNIADFSINGQSIALDGDGKFNVKDIEIGEATSAALEWTTVFGNRITREVALEKYSLEETGFFSRIENRVEPTCTESGHYEKAVYENIGGNEITRVEYEIAPTGHVWSEAYIVDIAAGCLVTGSESIHCINCRETKDSREIPATGHDWDDGTITTAPTCTEKGIKTLKCRNCSESRTEEIPAVGHMWGEGYTVDQAATCIEAGLESIHCINCGETKDSREIPVTGHDWDAGTITTASTCIGKGIRTFKCRNCSAYMTKIIPENASNHVSTELRNILEASCTSDGYTGDTCCADCGEKLSSGEIVAAAGHKMVCTSPKKNATNVASGHEAKYECSVCGYSTGGETIARISKVTLYVGVNKSYKLSSGKWSLKKTSSASLKGRVVTIKKAGTAKLTDKKSGKTVTIKIAKPSLKVNRTKLTLRKGGCSQIVATAVPSTKITYSSSRKSVATVSSSGMIKAKKKGKAIISVKANKVVKRITVTVK